MKYVLTFSCSVLSLLLGIILVRYLTCHPVRMSIYLFSACLLCSMVVLLFCICIHKYHFSLIPLLASLILFTSGYMGALYSFMNMPETRVLPQITRSKGDQGLGHTAVILLAHGEPETYDAGAWIKQMKEFDDQKISFIPYPFRPFFFNALRDKYLKVGKSGHNAECLQIMQQVEAEYRRKGDNGTKFYISYLENEPHPDTAVIQALNNGASHIVLCNIFLTISNHTQEAIDLIEPINLKDYGVTIKYTEPLHDSKTLHQLYVDKVNKSISVTNKENTGIILVGHGQPKEWDREFPTETQQEISFRTAILNQLALQGYKPQNLKLAWMEFREPEPQTAVEQLIRNGVTEIFYFSTIIGSESIHAKYDVPELMSRAKIPDTVKLRQLTAFEDESGIAKALMEKIDKYKFK